MCVYVYVPEGFGGCCVSERVDWTCVRHTGSELTCLHSEASKVKDFTDDIDLTHTCRDVTLVFLGRSESEDDHGPKKEGEEEKGDITARGSRKKGEEEG